MKPWMVNLECVAWTIRNVLIFFTENQIITSIDDGTTDYCLLQWNFMKSIQKISSKIIHNKENAFVCVCVCYALLWIYVLWTMIDGNIHWHKEEMGSYIRT